MTTVASLDKVEGELHLLNAELAVAKEKGLPFPAVKIVNWLQENEHGLFIVQNSRVITPLAKGMWSLTFHACQWPGIIPERGQILAKVQLLLHRRFLEFPNAREERLLNAVEAHVTPGHFPPIKRALEESGRICTPGVQYDQFRHYLEAREEEIRACGTARPKPVAGESEGRYLARRAQFVADYTFLNWLETLKLPNHSLEGWKDNITCKAEERRAFLKVNPIQMEKMEGVRGLIPETAFFNIKDLSIDFGSLNPQFFLPESLGQMVGLKALTLKQVFSFPTQVLGLTALQKMVLWRGALCEIPEGLSKLSILKILGVSHQSLNQLSETIGKLVKLEELYLNNNRVTCLPAALPQLTLLKKLNIDENRITHLPPLSTLTNLEWLRGNGNQLNRFPALNSIKLTYINLDGNQIEIIPESIGTLTQLIRLHLKRNPIIFVSPEISQCTALTHLTCDAATLPYLPDALINCSQLETVGPKDGGGWNKTPDGPSLLDYLKKSRTFTKLS